MSKKKVFQLGVIGLGVMGKHHARVAAHTRGLSLGAVADLDEKTAQKGKGVGIDHRGRGPGVVHQAFQLVDIGQPPIGRTRVGQALAVAQGGLPGHGLGLPLVPHQPSGLVGDRAAPLLV